MNWTRRKAAESEVKERWKETQKKNKERTTSSKEVGWESKEVKNAKAKVGPGLRRGPRCEAQAQQAPRLGGTQLKN